MGNLLQYKKLLQYITTVQWKKINEHVEILAETIHDKKINMISKTCESVQKNSKVCVITVLEREDIEKEHTIFEELTS